MYRRSRSRVWPRPAKNSGSSLEAAIGPCLADRADLACQFRPRLKPRCYPRGPPRLSPPDQALPDAGPELEAFSLRPACPNERPAAVLHITTHSELRARPTLPATDSERHTESELRARPIQPRHANDCERPGPGRPGATSSDPRFRCGPAAAGPRVLGLPVTRYDLGPGALVPRLALSVPRSRRRSDSRHPSQFPVAHRPSVPHARTSGPCARLAPSDDRSAAGPARSAPHPAGPRSLAIRVPAYQTAPCLRPTAAFTISRASARPAPSIAPPGPPGADPDPGPRLRRRGLRALAHKSGRSGTDIT